MNIEIPEELLFPTVEELEERTVRDLAVKRRNRKRRGKRERNAIKQEREAAKLKTAAEEFYRTNQNTNNSADGLSSLFVQKEKPKFSLNSINTGSTANSALRPTLRASLKGNVNGVITDTLPPKSAEADFVPMRRRGRPPKLKPI